jgi:hypothetical protein
MRGCSRTPATIRRHPPMLDEHRAEVAALALGCCGLRV